MLPTIAEFPHTGSIAFLRPRGEQVRILRANADGTRLIAFVDPRMDLGTDIPATARTHSKDASGNTTVAGANLAATRAVATAAALPTAKRAPKPRRAHQIGAGK